MHKTVQLPDSQQIIASKDILTLIRHRFIQIDHSLRWYQKPGIFAPRTTRARHLANRGLICCTLTTNSDVHLPLGWDSSHCGWSSMAERQLPNAHKRNRGSHTSSSVWSKFRIQLIPTMLVVDWAHPVLHQMATLAECTLSPLLIWSSPHSDKNLYRASLLVLVWFARHPQTQ